MRWGVKQRLEFIEFRLFWEGSINRKDLINTFGVSVPQASTDIKAYKKQAPGNIYYDKSLKQYLITSKFNPVFGSVNAHDYLSKLSTVADDMQKHDQNMMGFIPDFSVVPSIDRAIDPIVLRKLVKALKNKKAIKIKYQSMNRQSAVCRWITPHAFAFDGFRWHVRAYCELVEEFRDFILGRIISTQSIKKRRVNPNEDFKWNHFVKIKLAAHTNLSTGQKKIIEKEYDMVDGVAKIKVRAAFIYYVLLRFRLENPDNKLFLENKNVVLLNYNDLKEFI